MPVTIDDIKADHAALEAIKDKTELKPDHSLHLGHKKYNAIADLYAILRAQIHPNVPKMDDFHLAFSNLVMLTRLTLQVGIMEYPLGPQCKSRAVRALEFIENILNPYTYIFHVLLLFINAELKEDKSEIKAALANNIENSQLNQFKKLAVNLLALSETQQSAREAVLVREPILTTFARENRLLAPEYFMGLFNEYLMTEAPRTAILDRICAPLKAIPSPPLAAALPPLAGGVAVTPVISPAQAKAIALWEEINRSGTAFIRSLLTTPTLKQRMNSAFPGAMGTDLQTRYLKRFIDANPVVWSVDQIQGNLARQLKEAKRMSMWHVANWAEDWLDKNISSFKVSFLDDVELLKLGLVNCLEKELVDPPPKDLFREFYRLLTSNSVLQTFVKNLHDNKLRICDFFERNPEILFAEEIQTILCRWLGHFTYDIRSANILLRDKIDAAIFAHINITFGRLKQWIYNQLKKKKFPVCQVQCNTTLEVIDTFLQGVNYASHETDIYEMLRSLVSRLSSLCKEDYVEIEYHREVHDQFKNALATLTCLNELALAPIIKSLEENDVILIENYW